MSGQGSPSEGTFHKVGVEVSGPDSPLPSGTDRDGGNPRWRRRELGWVEVGSVLPLVTWCTGRRGVGVHDKGTHPVTYSVWWSFLSIPSRVSTPVPVPDPVPPSFRPSGLTGQASTCLALLPDVRHPPPRRPPPSPVRPRVQWGLVM